MNAVARERAGKFILISGCSSGIGLAAATQLQARGYAVIASCRKPQDIERLQALGLKRVIPLDLSCSDSIRQAVKLTLELSGGKLFALFNNGAYGLPGAVEDLPREALRRQFEVNFFGTHELTCALLPTLLEQPDARIVQNSSVLGFVAMRNRGAYVASKFALEGLTDTLRLELRGTAVKISILQPGPIASHFRQNALAVFNREIAIERSRHKVMYQQAMARLESRDTATWGTLPASAVVDALLRALEAAQPKLRYRVTQPTKIMTVLKRVSSGRWMDWAVSRIGG